MSNSISSPMVFKNFKTFHYTLAGRPLVVETGKLAGLANGSCLVRYGDTAVLCCATASEKPRDGIDFLPLSVDFDERMYAAGKIPGGYQGMDKDDIMTMIEDKFVQLKNVISEIKDMKVERDVLRSERSFDLIYITEFESLESLETYRVHPEHVKVAEFIGAVRIAQAVTDTEIK